MKGRDIERRWIPVGTNAWVVYDLVIIDSPPTLLNKPVLLTVSPDARCSHNGLLKVRINWRASSRLQTLQLTRGGHIETLAKWKEHDYQ